MLRGCLYCRFSLGLVGEKRSFRGLRLFDLGFDWDYYLGFLVLDDFRDFLGLSDNWVWSDFIVLRW